MAKITSGILGGMSGTIGNVTGYRRDGNSIITAKPNQPNRTLSTEMQLRNDIPEKWQQAINSGGSLVIARFINPIGTIVPYSRRSIDEVQQYYRGNNKNYYIGGTTFGIKQEMPTDGFQWKRRNSGNVQWLWNIPNFFTGFPANFQGRFLKLNLTDGTATFNGFAATPNTTFISQPGGTIVAGKQYLFQICFSSTPSSNNPTYLKAFPQIWIHG